MRAIYVYMLRSTQIDGYYDSISPYGYGGVLFDSSPTLPELQSFWSEYKARMCEIGIVDNFVRYHPVLKNAEPMRMISDVIDLGKTVAIDLSSKELIWENMTSRNRNHIRKSEKSGVIVKHGKGRELFKVFRRIYNLTMDKDQASSYYYFDESFYDSIDEFLSDNYELFYAEYQGCIIAMSIMLFANTQMHYHLSGSLYEYRNLAPTSILLRDAAFWGCDRGFKTLHLGGGVGSGEDDLLKFKEAFNRKSDYQFSIGKHVFDVQKYNELIEKYKETNSQLDLNSSYFPLYRA